MPRPRTPKSFLASALRLPCMIVILQGKDEQSNAAVICAQDGDIQTVAVNEKEFKNSLSVFSKEKDIIIETMSDKMPIVMRQHEDDKNKIFLMPVSE